MLQSQELTLLPVKNSKEVVQKIAQKYLSIDLLEILWVLFLV